MSGTALHDLCVPTLADAAELSACAQRIFCDTFAHMNYPPDDLATFLEQAMGVEAYARQIADSAYALRIVRGAAVSTALGRSRSQHRVTGG